MSPHWEHGYRVHGYWIGIVQWGRVGIQSHRHGKLPKTGAYGWLFSPEGIQPMHPTKEQEGRCDTLRQAKRAVEQAYREWLERHHNPNPTHK